MGPAPASLPAGAELAVLYGDPSKEGVFAMRLKGAKGYYIPPHTHPKPEINTVISGTVRLGMGDTADHSKAQLLPAGSFFALSPGMAHYVSFDEDTVVQVNTSGPWGINYVNPKDDPRKSQ
jgi:quercetin dioxygenase-like cupin family protein